MENKYYVYEWYIVDTDEVFYVGKGCGKRYKDLSKRNKFFMDMYRTHNCAVRILQDQLYEDDAYQLEYETVQWYKAHTNYRLTNQTDGGDGTRGFHPSEDHKKKVGETLRVLWQNTEWKTKIIEARHDPNSTYQSEVFKKKMSNLVKGEHNPNFGHHWTQSMKDTLRNKQKTSGRYLGAKNPNAKRIQCVETQETFDYIAQAQEKYNVKWPASFSVALDNPNRTAAGLHWVTIAPTDSRLTQ